MPTKTITTFGQKVALEARRPDLAELVGVTVKNGHTVQQGDVVGEITADAMFRRRTRAAVTGTAFATNSPTGTVDDVSVFKVGDVIKNAAGATVGTISAIDTATNTITLAANAAVAVATGANVFGSDGSQIAKGISDATTDGTETGIPVFVGGLLTESLIRGLDTTAKAELGGGSRAAGIFGF